jgi:hypothetical protein
MPDHNGQYRPEQQIGYALNVLVIEYGPGTIKVIPVSRIYSLELSLLPSLPLSLDTCCQLEYHAPLSNLLYHLSHYKQSLFNIRVTDTGV